MPYLGPAGWEGAGAGAEVGVEVGAGGLSVVVTNDALDLLSI